MATAVVVTGASRGFGRATATALAKELVQKQQRVDMFLWARDAEKLQDTERAVDAAVGERNGDVRTFSSSVDLGTQASYVGHVESLVQKLQAHEPPYETIYVIHNAASVGQLGCTDVWASATDLADYWELNLTHVCFFNARLLAAFKHLHSTRLVLVNVSSAAATLAVGGMGLYCTAKAAREMHFRVIAEEYKDEKRVRVLNYAPGAMDTDMQTELRGSTATPETTQALFKAFKEEGQLVRAEDSALTCAQILMEDVYETGSTIVFDPSKAHGS